MRIITTGPENPASMDSVQVFCCDGDVAVPVVLFQQFKNNMQLDFLNSEITAAELSTAIDLFHGENLQAIVDDHTLIRGLWICAELGLVLPEEAVHLSLIHI